MLARRRPERTLLYQLIEESYPVFKAHLAAQGTDLTGYVQQEFEEYFKCERLEHGFLRVRCDSCLTKAVFVEKQRPEPEQEPIQCREIRHTSPGTVDDQELLFDEQAIGDDCLRATRSEELGDCCQ
jgi:hypothetical protein